MRNRDRRLVGIRAPRRSGEGEEEKREKVATHYWSHSSVRLTTVALAVVFRLIPTMSFAATAVVQPVRVVECSEVFDAIAGSAEAVMVFETVGIAVPVAIFQTSTVAVPVSTLIFHALIVQANGIVR
jgi:hypothetical protein